MRRGSPLSMTGKGEVDVVEVWRMHGQPGDFDVFVIELLEQRPQRTDTSIRRDLQRQRVVVAGSTAQEPGRRSQPRRVRKLQPHMAAWNLALELMRRAFGDEPALIEHRDTAGALAGPLDGLRDEEDRDPARREAGDDRTQRGPAARVEARGGLVEEANRGLADRR